MYLGSSVVFVLLDEADSQPFDLFGGDTDAPEVRSDAAIVSVQVRKAQAPRSKG